MHYLLQNLIDYADEVQSTYITLSNNLKKKCYLMKEHRDEIHTWKNLMMVVRGDDLQDMRYELYPIQGQMRPCIIGIIGKKEKKSHSV